MPEGKKPQPGKWLRLFVLGLRRERATM